MCGIAGVALRAGQSPSPATLEALASALAHRGPDGTAVSTFGTVGLVHRRLAIVDLVTGAQPLARSGISLVANAEIYNDLELRKDPGLGPFSTGSDCESALAVYLRDGIDFAQILRGMYAIAIHDARDGSLVLSRDPFGIKPLYLAETADGLWFASEPQALVAAGVVNAQVDQAARDQVLAMQFSTELAFAGLRRVAPGETLAIRDGRIVDRRRRVAFPAPEPGGMTEGEALAAFDLAFMDSVGVHRRSDVPYGMFLSSGLDSSAVLAAMSRLDGASVLAFTAAFPGAAAHDERETAAAVAAMCGARHIVVEIGPADFWRDLPAIAAAVDDPVADYAIVPSYLLARRARTDIKVVLTGEGGDELFGGYGRYRATTRPWPFRRRPWRRNALAGLGILRQDPRKAWRSGIDGLEAAAPSPDRFWNAQWVDTQAWLPNDLLIKLDRCLMAQGIEGRVPFLDPAVAAVAARLPSSLKVRNGQGKYLLRRWLENALPGYDAWTAKRGFTVPVGDWIAGEGRRVGALVAAHPGIAEVCRPEAVKTLFANPGATTAAARWHLLFYALWHNRHMLGRRAAGSVFDVLSERT